MKKRFSRCLGVAALAACLTSAMSSAALAALMVPLNRSELIETKVPMAEVVVANPNIADIVVHGYQKFSVIGKLRGRTNIRVFDEENNVIDAFDVEVGFDLPAIRKSLRALFPKESVGVELLNGNLALTGYVSSNQMAAKMIEVAQQYAMVRTGEEEAAEQQDVNDPSSFGMNVVNLLKVRSGQQVMLRVRVGEIERTTLKRLGVSLSMFRNAGSFGLFFGSNGGIAPFNVGSELDFGQFNTAADNFAIGGASQIGNNYGLSSLLEALENDGLFKLMAEPNLVAISGERAEFLAGGEFPVPVAQDEGNISINFRQYGVGVQFIPYVLSENRIRLTVQPEVSELTDAGSIQLEGFNVPALSTRRAMTTVELAPGESFMIAGLINNRVSSTVGEMPGVAEIPIVSSLFRNSNFEQRENELVIAVTPYLVDPVADEEMKFPTQGYEPPSMMEMFFYGALGSMRNDAYRVSQTPVLEGPIGFMVD